MREEGSVFKTHSVSCLVTQLCPTLCNPMDCNPPEYSVHRILQARILEWVTMRSSRRSSWPRDPVAPALQADSLQLSHQRSPKLALRTHISSLSWSYLFVRQMHWCLCLITKNLLILWKMGIYAVIMLLLWCLNDSIRAGNTVILRNKDLKQGNW